MYQNINSQKNPKSQTQKNKKPVLSLIVFLFCLSFLIFGLSFRLIMSDAFSPDLLKHDVQGEFTAFNCPEIHQITSQKLHYLGEGMQAIAFVSADKKYVLKFFLKHRRYKKIRLRPAPFLQKIWANQQNKPINLSPPNDKRYVLESYDRAFKELKEETGLVAVHLSASAQDLPFCHLIGPQGQEHVVDLNRVSFVVQKYGALVKDQFSKLSLEEKKEALLHLEGLLQRIAEKGFVNNGKRFNQENFALLDQKAIMIDVGNIQFSEDQKAHPQKETQRLKKLLKKWQNSF